MVVWYDCFVYDESRFTGIYTYIHIYTYIYTHTHTYTQWRSRLENTFYQSTCICFVFIKFYFKFCVLVVPCHVHQHHLGLITELSEVMTGIVQQTSFAIAFHPRYQYHTRHSRFFSVVCERIFLELRGIASKR